MQMDVKLHGVVNVTLGSGGKATDSGTGAYITNLSNNMANVEFCGLGFANDQNYGNGAQSTSSLTFENKNDAGDASSDTNRISMAILGDLA